MRILIPLLIALAMVAVGWLLLRDDTATAPPVGPTEAGPDTSDAPLPDPTRTSRAPIDRLAEPDDTPTRPPPDAPSDAPPPDAALAHGNLRIRVLDRVAAATVPSFRYVLLVPGKDRLDRTIDGGRTELALPIDVVTRLRIEADGFEPQDFTFRMTSAEPERNVRIELERTLAATGIELRVQTTDFAPVRHLRVRAVAVNPRQPDAQGRELWHRKQENPEGVYRLPEMAPGTYRFELQATDAEDRLAALQTHREVVRFGGAEAQARTIQLRAGTVVELEVRDAQGTLLGEDVAVRVVHPAIEDPDALRWLATVDGANLSRAGGLPAAARVTSAHALPPGSCRFEVRRGSEPVHEHEVTLTPGRTQTVTITLPR